MSDIHTTAGKIEELGNRIDAAIGNLQPFDGEHRRKLLFRLAAHATALPR